MKKILSIILCLITILSLSGCYSAESKQQAREIRKEAKQIAVKYIEDKYGFTPKVINVQEESDGTDYSFTKYPTKDVKVLMKQGNKDFYVFVSGEIEKNKCYDSYEKTEINKDLKEYLENVFPLDVNIKVSVVSGVNPELDNGMIHTKNPGNLQKTINGFNESITYMVELYSEDYILNSLSERDFEEFFNIDLKDSFREIIVINYRNKNEIGEITPEILGLIDGQIIYPMNFSVYAKEITILNNNTFNSQNKGYHRLPDAVEFGEYKILTKETVVSIEEKPISSNKEIKNDSPHKEPILKNELVLNSPGEVYVYVDLSQSNLNKIKKRIVKIYNASGDEDYYFGETLTPLGKYSYIRTFATNGVLRFYMEERE